jgi:hypothetical protein
MKRPFGAKPVGCCTRLKNWTAANRRSGRAVCPAIFSIIESSDNVHKADIGSLILL